MEYCCPVRCEEYTVTPVFAPPPVRGNVCPNVPRYPPCLPEGPSVVYRCEKPPSHKHHYEEKHHSHHPKHDGEKHHSKHDCEPESHVSKHSKQNVYFCCELPPSKDSCMSTPTKPKKQEVLFCCTVPPPKNCGMPPPDTKPKPKKQEVFFCCETPPKKSFTPPSNDCCIPSKPIKTKYIIPCYRYEDGRVVNPLPSSVLKRNGIQDLQYIESGGISYIRKCTDSAIWCDYPMCLRNHPSELMRQACEAATIGKSQRKPFMETTLTRDHDSITKKFHSQDGEGNICFHFEKRKKSTMCCPHSYCVPPSPSMPFTPLPCVPSKPCLPVSPCMPCKSCEQSGSYLTCGPCGQYEPCGSCGPCY